MKTAYKDDMPWMYFWFLVLFILFILFVLFFSYPAVAGMEAYLSETMMP